MKRSSVDNDINKILLKPRFKIYRKESSEILLKKFKNISAVSNNIRVKVVDRHVVIDVPVKDEHFWSPQLQLEIEKSDKVTCVKGLFGPKPTLWTLFMFIHFGVALAFAIFATMLYTRWSLKQNYLLPLIITSAMPVLWIVFYFFGQWGKKKGHSQMIVLEKFMNETIGQDQK